MLKITENDRISKVAFIGCVPARQRKMELNKKVKRQKSAKRINAEKKLVQKVEKKRQFQAEKPLLHSKCHKN